MSGSKIEIRDAVIGDAAALADVGSDSFARAYENHSDPDDMAAHLEQNFSVAAVQKELEQGDSRYLLAFVDGKAAGMAKYREAACPIDALILGAVELQQLYVATGMQRHGLGRRLLDALQADAGTAGATGVWLGVWEYADWAKKFYLKAGFVEVGTHEFKVGKMSHTDLLMWLPTEQTGQL